MTRHSNRLPPKLCDSASRFYPVSFASSYWCVYKKRKKKGKKEKSTWRRWRRRQSHPFRAEWLPVRDDLFSAFSHCSHWLEAMTQRRRWWQQGRSGYNNRQRAAAITATRLLSRLSCLCQTIWQWGVHSHICTNVCQVVKGSKGNRIKRIQKKERKKKPLNWNTLMGKYSARVYGIILMSRSISSSAIRIRENCNIPSCTTRSTTMENSIIKRKKVYIQICTRAKPATKTWNQFILNSVNVTISWFLVRF